MIDDNPVGLEAVERADAFYDEAIARIRRGLSNAEKRNQYSAAARDALDRLADIWGLNDAERVGLRGPIIALGNLSDSDFMRVSALLGIFIALRICFGRPLADEWVRRPNTGDIFSGRRPIDVIASADSRTVLAIRLYIDAARPWTLDEVERHFGVMIDMTPTSAISTSSYQFDAAVTDPLPRTGPT